MLAFHGIGAYREDRDPLALRAMLNGVIGNAICAADRPIRAFGAVVCAPYALAFPHDVWSEENQRSSTLRLEEERFILELEWLKEEKGAALLHTTSEFMDYKERVEEELSSHHYCELWLEPVQVRALWVKSWADEKTKRTAKILAKHRGLPLLEVEGTTRIWDLDITEYVEPAKNLSLKRALENAA